MLKSCKCQHIIHYTKQWYTQKLSRYVDIDYQKELEISQLQTRNFPTSIFVSSHFLGHRKLKIL